MTQSKKMLRSGTLRWLVLGIMLANLALAAGIPVVAQESAPFFLVRSDQEQVHTCNWPLGAALTLTIDDPDSADDYAETVTVGPATDGGCDTAHNFELAGTFDIQARFVVTLSDGATTMTHTVTDLWLTGVDQAADTVSGTAAPGSLVTVEVPAYSPDPGILRHEQADGSGYWTADFSIAGDEGDEQDTFDIGPGTSGEAYQDAQDGSTYVSFDIPDPILHVVPAHPEIHGHDWPWESTVTLTIDDDSDPLNGVLYSETKPASQDAWCGTPCFDLAGIFLVQPGQFVVMSDGTTTRSVTVTELQVTDVDADLDTVSGIAVEGSAVQVDIHTPDGASLQAIAGPGDGWTADFTGLYDLQPGEGGRAIQFEVDGRDDGTLAYWWEPNPAFEVVPDEDHVNGWDWPADSEATLTLDDAGNGAGVDYTATQTPDEWGNVSFYLQGIVDIEEGDLVTLSDGTATKEHTVVSLTVTGVDPNTDTIWGTAEADSQVTVWTHEGGGNAQVTADASGDWSADLTGQVDLEPGWGGGAAIYDEDQDSTTAYWWIPNPTFAARPGEGRVEGWEWPLDAVVTLEIDDPGTAQNPDYSDTQTVGVAEWDPSQTHVAFSLQGLFELQPGHVVTLSDGTTTKHHTVTELAISQVDAEANTVSGTAEPGSNVDVWSCDDQGCANRHVVAEAGTWLADFAHAGPGEDERDIVDIVDGTSGDAAQSDGDGDSTQVRWEETHPRLQVSYEHDWVQISGFAPGGEVTYTIFDYEGGHALFGPVTGPVDSHGNGWISSNLHHTDLIPGYYVTARDEASGEEVSLLIRDLNLDYVGAEDDLAYGTAEPNATIELHISESHDQGFGLTVGVDGSGSWSVDLAAAGHPIDNYRHASVDLYDAEGDSVTAQAPRIHAQVSTDNFGVDNFSKNDDVTLTLYDGPGGALLYGPVTLRTDSSGNAWVNLWEFSIDLQDWHYIVAYDHTLDFTKELWIEPFAFNEMNTADDTVSGTSLAGEWVDLHVESLFSNWGLEALTGTDLNWFRDYGSEGYDITEQMWAYGWAIDDQGNWSQDHITGLPNIEASVADDWISGFNFTPDRPVWIGIYDSAGGTLLAEMETNADGNTQFWAEGWQHGIDLQRGMYLHVVDTETGTEASLTLVHLTFDGVDYDTERAHGQADPGTAVIVWADWLFDHYEVVVTADEEGDWLADFGPLGADLTLDWSLRALVFDEELDATVADAPRPPEFSVSFEEDWVSGSNWSRNGEVQIEIWADPGAAGPLETIFWETDGYGNFHAELWNQPFDVEPGQYVVVADTATGQSKATTVVYLTIEGVDTDNDLVTGFAPGEARISVNCWNDSFHDGFDLFALADGTWEADFGLHDIDLTNDTSCDARIFDEDNDATQANWQVSNPTFAARPNEDAVEGWQWPLDATITVSIDQDGDPNTDPECERTTTVTPAPWDPQTSWFRVDFQGECDLAAGDTVTVSDDQTTKTHVVTGLEVYGADAESDTVSGAAGAGSDVRVWLHEEWNSDLTLAAGPDGSWTADYSGMFDLEPGTAGAAVQEDDDGDQTWIDWEVPSPPFYCDEGSSISGRVTEANGVTELAAATIHFDDYHTGEELFYVEADEFGFYGCALPDGDYRVWAEGTGQDGTGYSREYYQEAIFEDAAMLRVADGATYENVNLTLDTPFVVYDHFTFNMTDPVLSDPAVRQAIAYGTDRARIIAETFPASPLMHSYLNPDHWAADYDQVPQYSFDPDLAADILTQAGWIDTNGDGVRDKDGQELHIVYVTTQLSPDHFRHTVYEIFVENMEALGISIEVVMSGDIWNQLFQQHDFGVAQFAWGFDVNDDTWPGQIFASDHDLNPGLYNNPLVDELLKEAEGYGTRAEKLQPLQDVQHLVMADLATLPLLMRLPGDNRLPTIEAINAPIEPVALSDQPLSVEVVFSDPDAGDVHEVTWDWGDESSNTQSGATSPASAEHTYGEPGVYRVEVTVTDAAGDSDSQAYEFIVVYDPSGGFVTGGGWIWSPAGAYTKDPDLEGRASFGFVSKYKKGASTPEGQTQFQFRAGDLNFHSDSYQWLVVARAKAMFKGVGTVNGGGTYGFMLSAIDEALTPSTDADLFRIKIWDMDDGDAVVYDNQRGADEDADPTTALGGGNIVVHKAK